MEIKGNRLWLKICSASAATITASSEVSNYFIAHKGNHLNIQWYYYFIVLAISLMLLMHMLSEQHLDI